MACETHVYILCRRVCCFLAPPSGLRVSSFKRFCSHQWPASRRYLPNGGSAAGSGPPLSKARFSGATAQPDLRADAPMPPTPVRHVCGHRFRVDNGEAVRRQHEHVCPRCGTTIVSPQSSGRVQSQHRTPKGKACVQREWVVRS